MPRAEIGFLGSPLTGYPLQLGAFEERRIGEAYRALLSGDRAAARALALQLLAANDGLHPALLILAQHDYLDRELEKAEGRIRPVLDELPDYSSARLIHGRILEALGDLVGAYSSYRKASAEFSVAAVRVRKLEPRAVEVLSKRIDDALARGRLQEASDSLVALEEWVPDLPATLRAAIDVARARDDPQAELQASRKLSEQFPDAQDVQERRAELELDVGSPGEGLRIFQDLAARSPGDSELADKVAWARFRWRLVLLPDVVVERADLPELNRADFATLLYWLFPTVRYGRAPEGRIANDVFDHPSREEIVRVVNMELMAVDPVLHRFEPDRAVSRRTALVGLLRLLGRRQPRLACLGEGLGLTRPALDQICRASTRCRLIPEMAECLPEATLSGPVAVEMSRRALEQLGIE